MAGVWDAEIKLLYAVDGGGGFFAVDSVPNGADFVVVANLEVGQNLMQVIDEGELYLTVRNLSQSTNLLPKITQKVDLQPQNAPENREERIDISGWAAETGDVVEAVCAFKATAGINTDLSFERSLMFVVD